MFKAIPQSAYHSDIGKNRLTRFYNDVTTLLTADELYLIALTLDIKPAGLLDYFADT